MRDVFPQLGQRESKARLAQKDGARRPHGLLCTIFFQFLCDCLVCPPFGLNNHRIREKFE